MPRDPLHGMLTWWFHMMTWHDDIRFQKLSYISPGIPYLMPFNNSNPIFCENVSSKKTLTWNPFVTILPGGETTKSTAGRTSTERQSNWLTPSLILDDFQYNINPIFTFTPHTQPKPASRSSLPLHNRARMVWQRNNNILSSKLSFQNYLKQKIFWLVEYKNKYIYPQKRIRIKLKTEVA